MKIQNWLTKPADGIVFISPRTTNNTTNIEACKYIIGLLVSNNNFAAQPSYQFNLAMYQYYYYNKNNQCNPTSI